MQPCPAGTKTHNAGPGTPLLGDLPKKKRGGKGGTRRPHSPEDDGEDQRVFF